MAAYLAPYLSQTGLTACWNGFLSMSVMISVPAAFISSMAASSASYQSRRCSACDAVAAQRVHGIDEERIAHHADLEALEIGNGPDRSLVVVDVARAGVHPAQRDQAGLFVRGNLRQQFVADLAVDHLFHVLGVAEDERHVENVDVVHDRADGADRNTGDLQRAELGLLDHFLFAAELHRGEHLDR